MGFTDNIEAAFETIDKDNLSDVRKAALETFKALGIPSARHEEWKYTNIKTKLSESLRLVDGPQTTDHLNTENKINLFAKIEGTKLVFINGTFSPAHSTVSPQSGVIVGNSKELRKQYPEVYDTYFNKAADSSTENFAALNTAFAQDGAFIFIQRNTKATLPVFVIHVCDAASSEVFTQSRNLIVVEDGAEVNIVEDFQNTGGEKFYNHVSEIFIGKNAEVNYTYLQLENKHTTSIELYRSKTEQRCALSYLYHHTGGATGAQ
jgi:Fe-S cluster assembly protein SufD